MNIQLDDGIELLNGRLFSFSAPDPSVMSMDELAHVLSNVCRFAGHISRFYSVAQHAVNVSLIVPSEHAKTALLHDTAEAFTNDIITPLKHLVPIFREIEDAVESAMAEYWGFQYPLPEEVKWADLAMLKIEKEILKPSGNSWSILEGIEVDHVRTKVVMDSLNPAQARDLFLQRWEELQ